MPRDDWARAKAKDIGRRERSRRGYEEPSTRRRPRKPRTKKQVHLTIPAGVLAFVRKIGETEYRTYRTKRKRTFDGFHLHDRSTGYMTFRDNGYELAILDTQVIKK